jgi:hypothetical protein
MTSIPKVEKGAQKGATAVLDAPEVGSSEANFFGYGRCGVQGCNCPAYGGSGDLCSNCGHNYGSHW